jgi:predicted dehydrogenase
MMLDEASVQARGTEMTDQPQKQDKRQINLAFIGGGWFAQWVHLPALVYLREHPQERYDLRLRGIYRRTQSAAEELAHKYRFEQVYGSLEELLHDESVDAVAVIVPASALINLLPPLAERKLPIFSEKPPGANAVEAEHFSKLIVPPNVVAFNRRFIPINNTFKQVVAEMTDVFFVEGDFFRSNRQEENFAFGTGIHWINYMEYLFGDIIAVRTQRFQHPQDEGWNWRAQLTFRDGLQGVLKIFPITGSLCERLEVHSPNRVAYLHSSLFGLDTGRIVIEEVNRDPETKLPQLVQTVTPGLEGVAIVKGGFVGQYQEFFEAICSGRPTRSNFQNAVNSMRVAEAIQSGVDWFSEKPA